MIRSITLSVALIAALCSTQDQPNVTALHNSPVQPGFSIQVTAPDPPIRLSGPIKVTVTVINNTDHTIYWSSDIGKDSQYAAFRYDLERNGHEVDTTFFHRKISGRNLPGDPIEVYAPSSVLLPHPPGKMFEMKLDLKRLYQITETGAYTFQVSRYDEGTKSTVRSNLITFDIVP